MELYGGEGVGKTELLLHLACSAILPTSHHGNQTPTTPGQQHHRGNQPSTSSTSPGQRLHHGNQTQVVWVDCDLKFSVLRLAVLLEQRIVNSERSAVFDEGTGETESGAAGLGGDCFVSGEKVGETTESGEGREVRTVGGGESDPGPAAPHNRTPSTSTSTGNTPNTPRCPAGASLRHVADSDAAGVTHSPGPRTTGSGLKRKAREMEGDEDACLDLQLQEQSGRLPTRAKRKASDAAGKRSESGNRPPPSAQEPHNSGDITPVHPPVAEGAEKRPRLMTEGGSVRRQQEGGADELNAEAVERRVAECLGRVQVVQCLSSQQLICTLHSLEAVIAANRNIALLVLDSVSAFFWSDKCSDLHHHHSSSLLHKNVSHVASVLKKIADSYGVLVVATKQALIKPRLKDKADSRVVSPSEGLGSGAGADKHVEMMGRAWSEAVTHRFVCSRSVQSHGGMRTTRYTLTGAAEMRHFTIGECGVCFDQ